MTLISSKRRHKTPELTGEDSEDDNADINNNKNDRRIKLDYMKHCGISRLGMESKRALTLLVHSFLLTHWGHRPFELLEL